MMKKKSLDEVAKDVIKGKYGSDPDNKLLSEGYNPYEVHKRVIELLKQFIIERGQKCPSFFVVIGGLDTVELTDPSHYHILRTKL